MTEKKKTARKKVPIKGVIDGSVLVSASATKQIPFVLFLTFMAIIYITNRYGVERSYKKINTMKKQIKELRSEAIATASELMYVSKESEVQRQIKERGMGLTESTEPPFVLVYKIDN